MGVGKTSIGRRLADRLRWPYLDNDDRLRDSTGRDAATIAASDGIDALHRAESDLVRSLADEPAPFIAGIPASSGDRPDELAALRNAGTTVYLRMQADALHAKALRRDPAKDAHRPWGDGDLRMRIEEMVRDRDPSFTGAADLVVDLDRMSKDEAAALIHRYLAEQGIA